jgi:hypothetical protein
MSESLKFVNFEKSDSSKLEDFENSESSKVGNLEKSKYLGNIPKTKSGKVQVISKVDISKSDNSGKFESSTANCPGKPDGSKVLEIWKVSFGEEIGFSVESTGDEKKLICPNDLFSQTLELTFKGRTI